MAQDQVHRLADLSVAFISLVEAPANQRSLLVKSASADQQVFERQVVIAKQDAARRIAYGLVLVPDEIDDWNDTIPVEEIEKAAYAFMQAGQSCCREGSRRQQVRRSRRCPVEEDRQGG